MPYGLTDSTPNKEHWMEKCVKGILKNSKFKSRNPEESRKIAAIKICKSQIVKTQKPKGMKTMADAIRRAGIR